jgi:hypothetical protein
MVTGAMVSARPVVSGRGARDDRLAPSPCAASRAVAARRFSGARRRARRGVLAFRGALPYFFAQDDFAGLARSAGLLPRLASPWRYLSGQVYFDAMRAIAGLSPFPYHLASLIAHLGCVALLFVFLSRRFGTAAAWVGATFFATHPALFTAVYSISGIGEILALLFGLAALLVAEGSESRRSLTVPLFALSLLCKESMVLLPFAVWLLSPGARRGASMVAALMVVSLLYLGVFLAGDVFGLRTALPADAAYSIGFGAHWLWNLLSYLGWTVNIAIFTVRGFTDAIDPRVYPGAGRSCCGSQAAAFCWGTRLDSRRPFYLFAAGAGVEESHLPLLPLRAVIGACTAWPPTPRSPARRDGQCGGDSLGASRADPRGGAHGHLVRCA